MREQRARSLRLIFEYQGDAVDLVSKWPMEKVAPAPQRLTARPDERGFWVELRDVDDEPLYRRAIANPIRRDMEVLAADGEHLSRVSIDEPAGRFSIVVPDIEGANTVCLVSTIRRTATQLPEIARFDLGYLSQEGQ